MTRHRLATRRNVTYIALLLIAIGVVVVGAMAGTASWIIPRSTPSAVENPGPNLVLPNRPSLPSGSDLMGTNVDLIIGQSTQMGNSVQTNQYSQPSPPPTPVPPRPSTPLIFLSIDEDSVDDGIKLNDLSDSDFN